MAQASGFRARVFMSRNHGEPSLWALLTSGPWVLSLLAGAVFWSCVVRLIYWLYEPTK